MIDGERGPAGFVGDRRAATTSATLTLPRLCLRTRLLERIAESAKPTPSRPQDRCFRSALNLLGPPSPRTSPDAQFMDRLNQQQMRSQDLDNVSFDIAGSDLPPGEPRDF